MAISERIDELTDLVEERHANADIPAATVFFGDDFMPFSRHDEREIALGKFELFVADDVDRLPFLHVYELIKFVRVRDGV